MGAKTIHGVVAPAGAQQLAEAIAQTLASDAALTATLSVGEAERARSVAETPEDIQPDSSSIRDGSASPATPSPPRYEPLVLLGEGGMGRVFEARDQQFGRVVALKEMRTEVASPGALRRFLVESLVTGNLEHPGIVAVYERGVRDGRPFYTMRKLDGRAFTDVLRGARTLNERLRLLPVLVKVCEALGFAHERGVVHRDLKPDNILVGRHGEVIVIDWGVAKVRSLDELTPDGAEASSLAHIDSSAAGTLHGSVLGTPAYMAPEQAQGRVSEVDPRSDVFALGAILYELLTGRAPYAGRTALEVLARAAQGSFDGLDRAAPDAPDPLRRIATRALAAARDDRYANAAELGAALEDFLNDAVTARESLFVRVVSTAVTVLAGMVVLVGVLGTAHSVSSFRAQGVPAWGTLFLTVLGLVASVIEWRTRGRMRLWPVALMLAVATLLAGIAGTATGFSEVMRALSNGPIAHDAERFRRIFAMGTYEILGLVAASSLSMLVQLFVLSLVYRATASAVVARAPRGATLSHVTRV